MLRPLYFYTCVSKTLGMGHYYRLKALAEVLPEYDPIWVVDEYSDPQLLIDEKILHLDEALKKNTPFIIDHRAPHEKIYAHKNKLAMIDDFGGNYPVDMIINGNSIPQNHHYTGLRQNAIILKGTDYTLLRTHFAKAADPTPKTKDLTIVIGSGNTSIDFLNLFKNTIFQEISHLKINLIVGRTLAQEILDIKQKNIETFSNLTTEHLIKRLQESKIAITTGGMIVYETLALGIPLIAYPYIPETIPEINWLESKNVLLNLGTQPTTQNLLKTLHDLIENQEKQKQLTHNAQTLIDGKGVIRVSEQLKEHIL